MIGDCHVKLELGHLVLNVKNLGVSVPFYRNVLRMRLRRRGKVNGRQMAFLSFGSKDHDIGLLEIGASAHPQDDTRVGLRHVAFRIGDRIEQLHAFKKHLDVSASHLAAQASTAPAGRSMCKTQTVLNSRSTLNLKLRFGMQPGK